MPSKSSIINGGRAVWIWKVVWTSSTANTISGFTWCSGPIMMICQRTCMCCCNYQQGAHVIGHAVCLLCITEHLQYSMHPRYTPTKANPPTFLPQIVKAEKKLDLLYSSFLIFHSLPVRMGLISVSATITPPLASITSAWLSSRAKSSFPHIRPPHYGATEIHSLLTVKSHTAGFQMLCTLTHANPHPSATPAAVNSHIYFYFFSFFACLVHKWCV